MIDNADQMIGAMFTETPHCDAEGRLSYTRVANRPLLIYVAGKLSAPTTEAEQENVRHATRVGHHLLTIGHHPIVPHWDWYAAQDGWGWKDGAINPEPVHYGTLLDLDLAILSRCDAILVLSESPGVRMEVNHARRMGIQVFTDVEEIPECSVLRSSTSSAMASSTGPTVTPTSQS